MELPIAMIIGGHPRSGTTMLNALCNTHPDITSTGEFKAFAGLWLWKKMYLHYLDYPKRTRPYVKDPKKDLEENQAASAIFYKQFTQDISRSRGLIVTFSDIVTAYHHCFPDKKIIGDKFPRYLFMMKRLSLPTDLRRVIIYRDPRDVIVSTLKKVEGSWKGKRIAKELNTVEKIAHHWRDAVEIMFRYKKVLHTIKYETIIAEPQKTLISLGEYLDVAPEGFDYSLLRDSSIGRYRNTLTQEDIDLVEKIAGKQMKMLGYL